MMLINPIRTEKAIARIEKENALTFEVELSANKKTLADEFEKRFGVKVDSVRVLIRSKGKKYAIVRLAKSHKAEDLAAKLKIVA